MFTLLEKVIKHVSAFLFAVATLIAFAQVIFRYIFNSSLFWAEELIRYLFIWMFFLGAAEASRIGTHVGMDYVISKFGRGTKRVLHTLIDAITLFLFSFIIYLGTKLAIINMDQVSPALEIPMGFIFLAIPVGTMLMLIFTLRNTYRRFISKDKEEKPC